MQEFLKSKGALILAILAALFFITTVSSCNNAYRNKKARDKEMATRLDLEEKVSKSSQDKTTLEDKVRSLSKELEEAKDTLSATKKALVQEQLVSQSIKEELQKVTRMKEKLEEELKQSLGDGKSIKIKK